MKHPDFSVIIPAYNEAAIIAETLNKVYSFFSSLKRPFEIIIVDDGSTDNTKKTAENLSKKIPNLKLISYLPNAGKGQAVKKGVLESNGKIVFFTDCDLSAPIETFLSFLPHLRKGADIVIGTRRKKESKITVPQPALRRFFNYFFYKLVFLIVPLKNITDPNCGFKAFARNAAGDIFSRQTLSGWGFDAEILYLGQLLGYKIHEVPVAWSNRKSTRVQLISASLKTIKELLAIRFNKLSGKYTIPSSH